MITWTIARQVPLSLVFYRQKCWRGLPFPSPRVFSHQGIEHTSSALAGRFFTSETPGNLCACVCVCMYIYIYKIYNQFSLHLCPSVVSLCDPMDCSMPGLPVHHQLPEFTQTHVHWVSDAIQPSHHLSSPSPPTFNLSQHQGLFWWVSFSYQVAKGLKLQLKHQSFQWIFKTDLL